MYIGCSEHVKIHISNSANILASFIKRKAEEKLVNFSTRGVAISLNEIYLHD